MSKAKKLIPLIITLMIILIGSIPFIEGAAWQCEQVPNVGGPNHPTCYTMWLSLLLVPGFYTYLAFGALTNLSYILFEKINYYLMFSIIASLNVIIYFVIVLLIKKILFKKKTT